MKQLKPRGYILPFLPSDLQLKSTLTPREEYVFRKRFFVGETLETIAVEFERTKERIRQIEAKAIKKIYGRGAWQDLRNNHAKMKRLK